MNYKSIVPSRKELKEIATLEVIQLSWGSEDATVMEDIPCHAVYVVKFNFHYGDPGFVSEYFILANDAPGEPFRLARKNRSGQRVLI